MNIVLEKLPKDKHRINIARDDGSQDTAELVSRSYLRHDLVHYALESTAGLKSSFYGLIADGASFIDLKNMDVTYGVGNEQEIQITEIVAGVLQSALRDSLSPELIFERVTAMLAVQNITPPPYISIETIKMVRDAYYMIFNQWEGLVVHGTLALSWQK